MNWRPNIDVTVNNYEILYSNNDITCPICKKKEYLKNTERFKLFIRQL